MATPKKSAVTPSQRPSQRPAPAQRRAPAPAQRRVPAPPPEYDNNERGVMFVNNRKVQDNHPDRTGSCVIAGVEYWISGWMRKSRNGQPYISLAFTEKIQQDHAQPGGDDFGDEPVGTDDLAF